MEDLCRRQVQIQVKLGNRKSKRGTAFIYGGNRANQSWGCPKNVIIGLDPIIYTDAL